VGVPAKAKATGSEIEATGRKGSDFRQRNCGDDAEIWERSRQPARRRNPNQRPRELAETRRSPGADNLEPAQPLPAEAVNITDNTGQPKRRRRNERSPWRDTDHRELSIALAGLFATADHSIKPTESKEELMANAGLMKNIWRNSTSRCRWATSRKAHHHPL